MREIKFRARWKDTGKVIPDFMEEYLAESINSDKLCVDQYTGLKDINGVEIYEGDIFRIEFLNDCIVEYVVRWIEEEHAFCFAEIERLKYEDDTDIWRRMTYEWTDRVTRLKRLKLTVIGNIYENQDLLKP